MNLFRQSLLASMLMPAALTLGLASASAAGSLPSGATSLVESHGNWELKCVEEASSPVCVLSQTQINAETRQQLVLIEISVAEAGGARGVLVMPFGLKLSEGVFVTIDGQETGTTVAYSTCLPSGCLVPLRFDASAIDAFGMARALNITAIINDSGEPITLSIDLQGFSAAFARMQGLLA